MNFSHKITWSGDMHAALLVAVAEAAYNGDSTRNGILSSINEIMSRINPDYTLFDEETVRLVLKALIAKPYEEVRIQRSGKTVLYVLTDKGKNLLHSFIKESTTPEEFVFTLTASSVLQA